MTALASVLVGRAPRRGFHSICARLPKFYQPYLPSPRSVRRGFWMRICADAIDALRAQGEVVIQLPVGVAHEEDEFICDRVLVHDAGKWVVQLNA
jgi:hypothetical protein